MAVFLFSAIEATNRWAAVVPRSNYLILAVVPWDSSAQHLVRHADYPSLDSSAITSTILLPMPFEVYLKYIYIYIVIHWKTVSLYHKLFSMDRHVGRLKLGSKPAQLYVRLSIIPLEPKQRNKTANALAMIFIDFVKNFLKIFISLTFWMSVRSGLSNDIPLILSADLLVWRLVLQHVNLWWVILFRGQFNNFCFQFHCHWLQKP